MLKQIEMPVGASGFKNTSNQFIYCYSQGSVTLTNVQAQTIKVTSAPCWVPPGYTINSGTSTDILLGLQGDIEDFAGFLSKANGSTGITAIKRGIAVTTAVIGTSAVEQEMEAWLGGANSDVHQIYWNNPIGGNSGITQGDTGEQEAWTHN